MVILIERSNYWWDYRPRGPIVGYRTGNYLSLETIDDLVYQYNYVGFNDLCIYAPNADMAPYTNSSSPDTKGIYAVYYGHTNQNQKGK